MHLHTDIYSVYDIVYKEPFFLMTWKVSPGIDATPGVTASCLGGSLETADFTQRKRHESEIFFPILEVSDIFYASTFERNLGW